MDLTLESSSSWVFPCARRYSYTYGIRDARTCGGNSTEPIPLRIGRCTLCPRYGAGVCTPIRGLCVWSGLFTGRLGLPDSLASSQARNVLAGRHLPPPLALFWRAGSAAPVGGFRGLGRDRAP